MQKLEKVSDALVVIGLILIIGYWIFDALAPVKYAYKLHKVASGETLYAIAQHYGKESTERDLYKIIYDIRVKNKISSEQVGNLQPGKVLMIPIQK